MCQHPHILQTQEVFMFRRLHKCRVPVRHFVGHHLVPTIQNETFWPPKYLLFWFLWRSGRKLAILSQGSCQSFASAINLVHTKLLQKLVCKHLCLAVEGIRKSKCRSCRAAAVQNRRYPCRCYLPEFRPSPFHPCWRVQCPTKTTQF